MPDAAMRASFDKDIFQQRLRCLQTYSIFLFGVWFSSTICLRDFTHNLGLILSAIAFLLLLILCRFVLKSFFSSINQNNLVISCYVVYALIGLMPFYIFMSSTDKLVLLNMFWLIIVLQISASLLLHMPFGIVVASACINFSAIAFLRYSQTNTGGLEVSLYCQGSALLMGLIVCHLTQKECFRKFLMMQKITSKAEENLEARARELKKMYLKELIHEIGTPLMVLSLGNESLQEMGNSFPEVLKVLKSNRKAIDLLTRLRERALDVTKQNEGVLLNPNYEKLDIRKLVYKRCSEIMTAFNSSKCHERVQMTYHVQQNVPKYIKSDEDFIWDMLCCLLSNARKFVTEGKIKTVVSYDEEEQVIYFKVFDTGKGVAEENRHLLFHPFTQFQSGSGGTGLGLYSVKLKAEALQGKAGYIDFSESDKATSGLEGYETGSIFWFSIPYLSVEETQLVDGLKQWYPSSKIHSSYKPSISSRLTSIEQRNHSSFFENIKGSVAPSPGIHLKEGSLKPTLYRNTKQAVVPDSKCGEKAESFSNIREMVSEAPSAYKGACNRGPVLTPSTQQLSHFQPNPLGEVRLNMTVSPRKPLSGRRLPVLHETLECSGRSTAQVRQSNCTLSLDSELQQKDTVCLLEAGSRKIHPILLIEDEVTILKLLSRMLKKRGYDVDTAENGKVGLQKLTENTYSCVFCDITMPEMDGYETLERFRKWERQQDPGTYRPRYVCALSANSDETSQSKAIGCGFDNFLSKPTNIKVILEEIQKAELK